MTCDEVRLQLPDHVLGNLPELTAEAIRRHLRGCASCRSDAADLGQGLSLFARAAHTAEPPGELKSRVMAVLAEDWTDVADPKRRSRGFFLRWPAIAALVAVLVGSLGWAVASEIGSNRLADKAESYDRFLQALGGTEVRVATIHQPEIDLEATVILYDSTRRMSWVLVLARAPGYSEALTTRLSTPQGRSIEVRFPLEFGENGDAWSGMVTDEDISAYSIIELVDEGGRVVASGRAITP